MNRIQSKRVQLIFVFGGLLFVSFGCQSKPDGLSTVVAQGEIVSTVTAVLPPQPVPETVMPTATLTPMPTATSTLPPTLTPSPTKTASPTPWPTLPPDEATEKVLALLMDNQNPDCLLPCWWGATPGQTKWEDIAPFLNALAGVDISSSGTFFGATVTLPLPESVIGTDSGDSYVFYGWDESGVIHGIDVDPINISGYDAKTMVTLYGVPDEVWLKTISMIREGVLPFHLIIVYQEKGISFHYYLNATIVEETITACFEPGFVEMNRPDLFPASPRIYVWESGHFKSIEEISLIPMEVYFPLETKTDLTPELLFERFTNPNEQPCIETPADLWKGF